MMATALRLKYREQSSDFIVVERAVCEHCLAHFIVAVKT